MPEEIKDMVIEHGMGETHWVLRLYAAGKTPKSLTAFANLQRVCEKPLHGQYQIEVIDLKQNPQQARVDEIVVLPTLVKMLPLPSKRLIGDLSDRSKVLLGLGLPLPPKEETK